MRAILAMTAATWKAASSYRVSMVLSLLGLVMSVIPLYFVAGALQDTMSGTIRGEGGQYFAFVLAGMLSMTIVTQAVSALPSSVGSAATSGTLDSLVLTPTPLPVLFAGLAGYGFVWTAIRAAFFFTGGVLLGAPIVWGNLPAGIIVLILLAAAYLPFGLLMTAGQIAFRTSGPLLPAIILVSTLLGGVYYPVHVIPSWLQALSWCVPLTYGLRAFRRLVLEGAPLVAVAGDVAALLAFTLAVGAIGAAAVAIALRYARRTGTLMVY